MVRTVGDASEERQSKLDRSPAQGLAIDEIDGEGIGGEEDV